MGALVLPTIHANKEVSLICLNHGEEAVVHGASKNVLPHEFIFYFWITEHS
jgi:hypothetical protein